MRGTDFNRYKKYLEYFITNDLSKIGLESGISYYWFISKVFDFYKTPLFISEIYVEPTITASIQIGNLIFFVFGLFGLYKLLNNLGYRYDEIIKILIIVSLFIPLIGARIILKPEIMAFAFLPWLLLLYNSFFETKNNMFLYLSIPILSSLVVLKSSITFMIGLSILVIYGKKIINKNFIRINLITFLLTVFLVIENFEINGNYLWQHIIEDNYNNKASLSYIYLFNPIELFQNPFRNELSGSMISIILADTFGDYWQRYWFHKDGWSGDIFPGDIMTIRISLVLSLFFYIFVIFSLLKEKNKKLQKIGVLGFVGVFALIVNAINLFPFLTKNFDPSKGDPMKTHLFSFLLSFTLIYFLIKIRLHKNQLVFISLFVILNIFFFSMAKGVTVSEIRNSSFFLNKVHVITPCLINDALTERITYSDSWCSPLELSKSICKGEYDPLIVPYEENDFTIYPKDESYKERNLTNGNQIVTVANYFECLNYTSGGYSIQSSAMYVNNNNEGVFLNKILLLLAFSSGFLSFFKGRKVKTKTRKIYT